MRVSLMFWLVGMGTDLKIVFQELPASDKSRLLSQLAAKVFSHAVGSG